MSFFKNLRSITHDVTYLSEYIQPERQLPFHIYIASLYHNETYAYIFRPFEDLVRCLGNRLVIYQAQTDNSQLSYDIEKFQRNQIYDVLLLLKAQPNDIVYISDTDEIPLAPVLESVISNPPSQYVYYGANKYDFSLRWLTEKGWPQPYFVRFGYLHGRNDIEALFHPPGLEYKGIIQSDYIIHLSSAAGSVHGILAKLQSFAQAYNFDHHPLNDINHIYARAACGEDYLGRGFKYSLQEPFSEKLIPILKDPRMKIMNEKIPFRDLKALNVSEVIKYKACEEAVEYLREYQSKTSINYY